MFLSIIIPVYNSEKYLEECLRSILVQNVELDDFEIICINDGSTDNSLNILMKYAEKYKNIVIVNQQNKGVSVARNRGIESAKGEYIWFIDSDDIIKPNALLDVKEKCLLGYELIDFYGYSFREELSLEEKYLFENEGCQYNEKYWGHATFHVYKKEFIDKYNIRYNPNIKFGEDEMFNHEVYVNVTKVCCIEKAIYYYRKNKNSTIGSLANNEVRQKERMESIIMSMCIIKYGIESGKYNKQFTKNFYVNRFNVALHCMRLFNIKLAKEYLVCMDKKGLFDVECDLMKYDIPRKNQFFGKYLKQHNKIWLRRKYKTTRAKIKRILLLPINMLFSKKI